MLGLTFLFSGFVKAIDPLGLAYKYDDYLLAFGLNSPDIVINILAVLLPAFEFLLGSLLILGIWPKFTGWVVFLFMLVMTPFTFYLAIKNPVTDCGCFGDALVITNWQTFIKNVVLLLLSIFILWSRGLSYTVFGTSTAKWSCFWSLLLPVLLSLYAYRHLPLIDFRPYKIGNNLAELTKLPPTAVVDSFDYKFIYEKDGVRELFTAESLPQDGWTFVDRTQVLVRKGDKPVIDGLQIMHPSMGDITDDVLSDTSYVFLLVSPDLSTANSEYMDKVTGASRYAHQFGYKFYGLTASDLSVIDEWSYEYDTNFDFCAVDDRILKTMIRSNPGLIILKDGVVVRKWASIDLPNFHEIKKPLNETSYGTPKMHNGLRMVLILAIYYSLPLLFFFLFHTGFMIRLKWLNKRKSNNNKQV